MTSRLLLNSTKSKDYARWAREVTVERCVCVLILYPSCIYSREPWVRSCQSSTNQHCEPIPSCHVATLRWWGPWAGRPTCLWREPPPILSAGLVWASSGPNTGIRLVLRGFGWFSGYTWSDEPESMLWYFLWFYVGPKCACNLHISSKTQLPFSRRWSVV